MHSDSLDIDGAKSFERRTKLLVDLFSHGMTLNLC